MRGPRRELAMVAVVLCGWMAGCESPADEARNDFSRTFSCPKNDVALRKRTDVDPYYLRQGGKSQPPPDVAADPRRLAVWQANQQKDHDYWSGREAVFEVKGCSHENLYLCDTSTSTGSTSHGNTGWGCRQESYPPGTAKW